ncbi:hypothetical protein HYS97_02425 [Candidatus Daviesbacteria bacterium]|nr:hypothetical protein [Candidatus Daviesbacteria bacterium]
MEILPKFKNIQKEISCLRLWGMNFAYELWQAKIDFLKRLSKKCSPKQIKYALAATLDFVVIIVLLINFQKPVQRLISPLVESLQSLHNKSQITVTKETFSFAPGLAQNKFDDIDFSNLTYLSFFDVAIDDDGQLYFEGRGYSSFKSEEALSLFEKARLYNTKVLLTINGINNRTIATVLNDPDVQNRLLDQITTEIKDAGINGVSIDFEYKGEDAPPDYREKFSNFISKLKMKMHQEIPGSTVAVVIPSTVNKTSRIYNLQELNKVSDRIFVMASDYLVPEFKNGNIVKPVYGFNEGEYWKKLANSLSNLTENISEDKLVMERAWYGNGNNYPLYKPSSKPVEDWTDAGEPAHVFLDSEKVERLASEVPPKARNAARRNIPLIGKALENEGILDSNVLAYALATIEHETDETFEPLDEIGGRMSARRLGYEGGTNYFGRGFIQLTHLRNYRMVGERIGLGDQLVKNPELAKDPEISARILAAFFKDNNVANLASKGDFYAARIPVNPDYNSYKVAALAWKYGESLY